MSQAIGMIFEDPNIEISKEGKKLIDVMQELNPNWDALLKTSTRQRYKEWNFPMQPYPDNEDTDKQIGINAGDKMVHPVTSHITLDIKNPILADI